MIKAYMTIFDGCEYSHHDVVKIFKDEDDLKEYIASMNNFMDEVYINKIEVLQNEKQ